ncbi:MAG: hypothetical protein ACYC5Y_11405 [Symbiobacteriia bacterium]
MNLPPRDRLASGVVALAIRVEGVFRLPVQAAEAVRELREQGLSRSLTLAAAVLPAVPSGYAALFGDDWSNRPLRLTVTTSPHRAPEVARLLRQFGAEEVDLS